MIESAELSPGLIGWIRPGSSLEPAHAREWLESTPAAYLRRMPGRDTFAWPHATATAPYVVKRARGRESAAREFEVLEALARDGIAVPGAIAWCEELGGRMRWLGSRRSCVVMERIAHVWTLRQKLAVADGAEMRRLGRALLELVVRLHERGWYHRDLYLHHVVLRENGELVLLDVARARHEAQPRERWFLKDLAALLHSTPRAVGEHARLRFAAAYFDRRDIGTRGERRRWLARIAAKERRMSAHTPRRGEDHPWQDK